MAELKKLAAIEKANLMAYASLLQPEPEDRPAGLTPVETALLLAIRARECLELLAWYCPESIEQTDWDEKNLTGDFGLIKTSYKATAALVTALDVALFESKPLPNP